jgi:hypothetical protein
LLLPDASFIAKIIPLFCYKNMIKDIHYDLTKLFGRKTSLSIEHFNSKKGEYNMNSTFRIVLGNTERSAEEVISFFRHHVDDLAGLQMKAAETTPQRVGQLIIDVQAPTDALDTGKLRKVLNETGECMFQVDSIEKV